MFFPKPTVFLGRAPHLVRTSLASITNILPIFRELRRARFRQASERLGSSASKNFRGRLRNSNRRGDIASLLGDLPITRGVVYPLFYLGLENSAKDSLETPHLSEDESPAPSMD